MTPPEKKASTPSVVPAKRTYSPKPAKGSMEKALDRISSPTDRTRQHNQMVVDGISAFPEFTMGGLRIVPTGPVHIDPLTKMVEIRCFIFDAETGVEIEHPDGRFQFERPPYRVQDGTWRKEGDYIRPNLKEDLLLALQRALVSVILTAIGRQIPTSMSPTEIDRYVTDGMGFRITNSGKILPPPEVDGRIAPYGDPPAGETWKERE